MKYFKIIILFGLIGIYFASCSKNDEEVEIPDHLIAEDTLVKLFFDIHIADAYLANNRLPKENLSKDAFYEGIFTNYNCTREEFDSTIAFLTRNTELYASIYDKVLNEFSMFEAEIEREETEEKERKNQEREKRKEEYYKTTKVSSLKDTIEQESVHDSIFLDKVQKAKKRFQDRKQGKKVNFDSLSTN